jgi:hypothetical protein
MSKLTSWLLTSCGLTRWDHIFGGTGCLHFEHALLLRFEPGTSWIRIKVLMTWSRRSVTIVRHRSSAMWVDNIWMGREEPHWLKEKAKNRRRRSNRKRRKILLNRFLYTENKHRPNQDTWTDLNQHLVNMSKINLFYRSKNKMFISIWFRHIFEFRLYPLILLTFDSRIVNLCTNRLNNK